MSAINCLQPNLEDEGLRVQFIILLTDPVGTCRQLCRAIMLENTVRDELEGEITLQKCQDILRTFKQGKSPGEDRFTWEFFNYFFDLLGPDLVDSFNSAYHTGEMSISQRCDDI